MNPIELLISEFDSIYQSLMDIRDVSSANNLQKNYRKILLLSIGSFFEYEITSVLSEFVNNKSGGDIRIVNFLKKAAIEGRYFQLFDWGSRDNPDKFGENANKFYSYFGSDFKSLIVKAIDMDPNINIATAAFLRVGHLRNILVHSNLAQYEIDNLTVDEIKKLFYDAAPFIDFIRSMLL